MTNVAPSAGLLSENELTGEIVPPFSRWQARFTGLAFAVSGLVLLTAAVLKLVGLNVAPFAQYGWLLTPTVQTAAVVWELVLGVWLLSSLLAIGHWRAATARERGLQHLRSLTLPARQDQASPNALPWLFAVLTFVAFAVVSGYLGVIGQANCGCFGVIQASPWSAFAVDLGVLALLALGYPTWTGWTANLGGLKWVAAVGVVLALLAGVGTLAFGSLDAAVAKLRGESLGVTPSVIQFGIGQPGDILSTNLMVRNFTSRPVQVIGGTADCSCIATHDLPLTITPGGRCEHQNSDDRAAYCPGGIDPLGRTTHELREPTPHSAESRVPGGGVSPEGPDRFPISSVGG